MDKVKKKVHFDADVLPPHFHIPKATLVGLAYGPEYPCGITAFNVYNIKYDPSNKQLYVMSRNGDEPVHPDGTVAGSTKRYKLSMSNHFT